MRATVKDVARRAGVSPKTVSNVVNGTYPVSEAVRTRVEEAVTALDYVPNLSARGLRNGRTGLIALALPDLSTPYSAELAHHFVVAAARRQLSVQIEETALSGEREQQLLSRARAHLIDGLVLNPVLLAGVPARTGGALPPVVFIGEVAQAVSDHVWIDNVAAARDLTTHLLQTGRRRIAALGVMGSETSRLRLAGYRQALQAAGCPVDPELEIPCQRWTSAGGAAALTAHLAGHPRPDAVFCFTDSLALGVLHALWTLGHPVPDDVAVVGYDDVIDGEYAVPPLTTLHFDKGAYSEAALDLLTARIADPDRPAEQLTVPHRVIIRASSRR